MNWKDAYEAQMNVWEFLRSRLGRDYFDEWIKSESSSSPRKATTMRGLAPYEEHKLLGADPVYINRDMVDLIEFARESWKPEMFLHEDMLVWNAFVYLERPIFLKDRRGNQVNVKAVSWAPITKDGKEDEVWAEDGSVDKDKMNSVADGLAVTLYSTTNPDEIGVDVEMEGIAQDYTLWHGTSPELLVLHVTPVFFNVDPDWEKMDIDHPGMDTAYNEWWSMLQVTIKMMNQQVTARETLMPDRHSRRRGIRKGFDPREVLVVKLRRPRHEETQSERDVEWTHRWIVSGHWRNQFMPASGTHRMTWISPYVKGPDDAPLIVKRRAYEWSR